MALWQRFTNDELHAWTAAIIALRSLPDFEPLDRRA